MVMFFNTANLASNSNVGVRHAHFDSWPPKQESEALGKLNGIELIEILQVNVLLVSCFVLFSCCQFVTQCRAEKSNIYIHSLWSGFVRSLKQKPKVKENKKIHGNSMNERVNQSINQSINQSVNQVINQSGISNTLTLHAWHRKSWQPFCLVLVQMKFKQGSVMTV